MSVPCEGVTDDPPLHRAFIKMILHAMVGKKRQGRDKYVPEFKGDVHQMTSGMCHNVALEVELPLDHQFWASYWARSEEDRPVIKHQQVPYFSPQLLACFDTAVADVPKNLIKFQTTSPADTEEATQWWEETDRMNGFDESYLEMWDLPTLEAFS